VANYFVHFVHFVPSLDFAPDGEPACSELRRTVEPFRAQVKKVKSVLIRVISD